MNNEGMVKRSKVRSRCQLSENDRRQVTVAVMSKNDGAQAVSTVTAKEAVVVVGMTTAANVELAMV